MSFTAQIGYLTGDASANDATVLSNALNDGVKEVITKVAQINPSLLHSMSSDHEATSNTDSDNQLTENNIVLNVTRYDATNTITRNCTPIDKKNVEKAIDTDSLYYAPITSPVYVVDKARVLVYPVPSGSEKAVITKVVAGTISDGTNTILNMPTYLHQQVVRFAARECLIYRIGEFTKELPTDFNDTTVFDTIADFDDSIGVTTTLPSIHADYQDAVDKAQNLIDDVASIGGDVNTDGSGTDIYSAQKWLIDEDPEMLNGTLSTAAQELQRAQSVLTGFNAELSKYQAEITKESAEAGQALQEYQANLTKKVQSFTTLIGKITTDYGWLVQQLGVVTQQLAEGWSAIQIPDMDSQAKGLGGGIGK